MDEKEMSKSQGARALHSKKGDADEAKERDAEKRKGKEKKKTNGSGQ